MTYISGPYVQRQIIKDIIEAETALTNRWLRGGAITDAAEQKDWRYRIEDLSFGRNTVMFGTGAGAVGYPAVMVMFPSISMATMGFGWPNQVHPAFIVNGVIKPEIWIAKFKSVYVGATVGTDAGVVSLRGLDPGNSKDFDTNLNFHKAMGAGFHLQTLVERSLVAQLCKKQGFWPRGNNYYGKDIGVQSELGSPTLNQDASNVGRTATGSGPLAWYHDGTPFGLADVNGNAWEWCGGMRLNNGEIQILQNNNGADNTKDQSATSTEWKAILQDGTLVNTKWLASTAYALNTYLTPGNGYVYKVTTAGTSGTTEPVWPTTVDATVTDGTVVWTCVADLTLKYDSTGADTGVSQDVGDILVNTTIVNSLSTSFAYNLFQATAAATGVTIPNILKYYGLFPIDSDHGGDGHWMRNSGERLPVVGGAWGDGSAAGVCSLSLGSLRSDTYWLIGARLAFA